MDTCGSIDLSSQALLSAELEEKEEKKTKISALPSRKSTVRPDPPNQDPLDPPDIPYVATLRIKLQPQSSNSQH